MGFLFTLLTLLGMTSINLRVTYGKNYLVALPQGGGYRVLVSNSGEVVLNRLGVMRGIPIGVLRVRDSSVKSVTIQFDQDPWRDAPKRAFSPSFFRIFKEILVNPPEGVSPPIEKTQGEGARLLVIVADSFYSWNSEEIDKYIDWKSREGFMPKMVLLSSIGETALDIKNYISNAYFNWDVPPEYVLLVGDPYYLPCYTYYDPGGCGGTYVADNYFVTVDGNDVLSDLIIGRMSVMSPMELSTVIEKSLGVDRNPYVEDPNYFKRAVFMAADAWEPDSIYYLPKRYAKDLLLGVGFTEVDTFFCSDDYTPSSEDVLASINQGCQFVNFRANSGGLPAYPFMDVVPDQLQNGWRLPIYVAISCLLGIFNEVDPSYDEMWVRAGTPTQPKGAVAMIAASGCSVAPQGDPWFHTRRRNAVDRGMFDGFVPDSLWHLGEAFNRGKLKVFEEYPDPEWAAVYHYNEENIQGDPTLSVWTDTPQPLEVDHPSEIYIENPEFSVTVRKFGDPIKEAVVCIRMDTLLYMVGTTDETGTVTFTPSNIHPGLIDLTVTAQNGIPDTSTIIASSSGAPFIYPVDHFLVDDEGGNGDSLPNPGEIVNFGVTIVNVGGGDSYDTKLILRSQSAYITVIDSTDSLGLVEAGDTLTTTKLSFRLSTDIPDSLLFTLTLSVEMQGESTLTFPFSFRAHSPVLTLDSTLVFDEGSDYFLDPGDSAWVAVYLTNRGSASTGELTLNLSTFSPFVTIVDSIIDLPSIEPNHHVHNTSGFNLTVSDTVPEGTEAYFQLVLFNQFGFSDTMSFALRIGGRDYLIYEPVKPPSPGVSLSKVLNSLGYKGVYLTDWSYYRNKLSSFKSVWVTLGAPPSEYTLTDESDVNALIDYLDRGGSLYIEGARVAHSISSDLLAYLGVSLMSYASPPYQVVGVDRVFTKGYVFGYNGEFFTVDKLMGLDPKARVILKGVRGDIEYDVAVAYPEGGYRTLISSAEVYRLVDSLATKEDLVQGIMNFFLHGENVKGKSGPSPLKTALLNVWPNPTFGNPKISFTLATESRVVLDIYNSTGRVVSTPINRMMKRGRYSLSIPLIDIKGRRLAQGVYFLRLSFDEQTYTRKLVILR